MWLTILKYAAAPVIGAVIGYFTNYIAVKMLFYPKKPVMLFGHKLPLTPGVIPKGKPRLARAIGRAVADTLITKEDLESKIMSDDVTGKLAEAISVELSKPVKEMITKLTNLPDDMYENGKDKVSCLIGTEVLSSVKKLDFERIYMEKAIPAIMQSISNPMLRMFVNENMLGGFAAPVCSKIRELIETQGESFVNPMIKGKLNEVDSSSGFELAGKMNVSEAVLNGVIVSILKRGISSGISSVLEKIDIADMVESKINGMDIDELETLILQVMKKELNTIINLGALIGLILGAINLIIQNIN